MVGQKGERAMLNKFLLLHSPTASGSWSKGKVDRKEAEGPITVLWEERLWVLVGNASHGLG